MIKCIATDMDGTLLTAGQEITKLNREAIKKAQELGIEVVVATGRSYQEASFVLKGSGIRCPIICVNGAEVRTADGDVVSTNPLEKALAKKAAQVLLEKGIYFELYTNKGTFTTDEDKGISIIIDILMSANPEENFEKVAKAAEERFTKGLVHKVDSYDDFFDNDEYQVYKFLAFDFNNEHLQVAREALREVDGLEVTSSGFENIEIMSQQAKKGIALEAFTKSRGISLEDTMAIGDNYNDLSMFERVGRAVAMGNASGEIKKHCHIETKTNEESGVGEAILQALES